MPVLRAIERSWWVKIQQRTIRGIPDILGVVKGRLVAIELKDEAKIDALQEVTLQKIGRAGGLVSVMTPRNFDSVITTILERTYMGYAVEFSEVKKCREEVLSLVTRKCPEIFAEVQELFDKMLHACQEIPEKVQR